MNKAEKLLLGAAAALGVATVLVAKLTTPPLDFGAAAVTRETEPTEPHYDLNTVTKAELMTVPGMSETMADRILAYRDTYGFTTLDELREIRDVSRAELERWCEIFYVK